MYRHDEYRTAVVSTTTAFFVASMLADVMNRGTGATARAHGFRLPAGGKTGTSQDAGDVWFIGFTPSLLAGVWFGYDRAEPIARHGSASSIAVPAWAAFMRDATKGDKPAWLDPPSNLRQVSMCRLSGQQATDACRQALLDYDTPSSILPSLSVQAVAVADEGSAGTPPRRPGVYREYRGDGPRARSLCCALAAVRHRGAATARIVAARTTVQDQSVGFPSNNGVVSSVCGPLSEQTAYSPDTSRRPRAHPWR